MRFTILAILIIGWSPWANAADTEKDNAATKTSANDAIRKAELDWKGLDYYYEQELKKEQKHEINR